MHTPNEKLDSLAKKYMDEILDIVIPIKRSEEISPEEKVPLLMWLASIVLTPLWMGREQGSKEKLIEELVKALDSSEPKISEHH